MSEHTIAWPCSRTALRIIVNAINYPDSLHDFLYAAFQARVPDWAEHGWELRAAVRAGQIIVTARRKT